MKFNLPRIMALLTGLISLAVFYFTCWPVLRECSQEPTRELSHQKQKKAVVKHEGEEGGVEGAEQSPFKNPLLYSVGEIIVHIPGGPNEKNHSLGMKLELEFFEEEEKDKVKEYLAVVKDSVIQVALERNYESLTTLPGKYAFKETMVEKINQSFQDALIKDIHFTAFLLK